MIVDLSGAALSRQIISPSISFQNYITIEEDPEDEAVITRHPVEVGAVMSDHIYLQPPQVRLRLGWSNADPGSTGASYVRDIYAQLLQLKNNRQLFTAYTGKRLYKNMFVPSIRGPHTDSRFEYSMIVDLVLMQLLLVSTQTTTGAPTPTTAGPSGTPGNNATPQTVLSSNMGALQTPATNTTLNLSPDLQGASGPLGLPSVPGSPSMTADIGTPNTDGGGAGNVQTFFGPF